MLLLISERPHIRTLLTEHLSRLGVYLYRAVPENAAYLCEVKDIGGVILDCLPHTEHCTALCRELRKVYPEMPIAAIHPNPEQLPLAADRIWRGDQPEALLAESWDFCRACGWWTEPLSVFYLTVGNDAHEVYYMGYPLHLSPREHRLLRCLFYRAPRTTPAADLLELCFPETPLPLSGAASLVSRINRRASTLSPIPLIEHVRGEGYRLRPALVM